MKNMASQLTLRPFVSERQASYVNATDAHYPQGFE